jgi:hypothetical protein
LVLKAELEHDEPVKVNDPVFVDGTRAGHVRAVQVEAGERIAALAITDPATAKQKLRAGAFRLKDQGRIAIFTEGMAAGAEPLKPGTVIPTKSKPEYLIRKYAAKQTLAAVAIGGAALVLLCLIVKTVSNLGLMLAALLLAALTGWVLHPHATPWVQKAYASLPDVESAVASAGAEHGKETVVPAPGEKGAGLELKLIEVLNRHPDPRVISFAALSVAGFVLYALLLGTATRFLLKR